MSLEAVLAAFDNAPPDSRPEAVLRAEAALVAECDPDAQPIPGDEVSRRIAARAEQESAAE